MTTKEKYQDCFDEAYKFAPYEFYNVIDRKVDKEPPGGFYCDVCGNHRLRYLYKCEDSEGTTRYIGRNCYKNLEERYEEEHKHGHS